jgi:hypothetical protein
MTTKKSFADLYRQVKQFLRKRGEEAASNEEFSSSNVVALQCEAFFNYTIFLPNREEDEEDVMIMGQFMIKNTGSQTLHHPLLCIRLEPAANARLGGKIAYHEHLAEIDTLEQWQFVHEDWKEKIRETGEYWLKPKHCLELAPGETLVFSNFELQMRESDIAQLMVAEGFVYAQELREGIASLNTISIHF